MPTQEQLDNFWWGTGGSEGDIKPGAYATMRPSDFNYLYATDAGFSTLYLYCQKHRLYGFANYDTTGAGLNQVGAGG